MSQVENFTNLNLIHGNKDDWKIRVKVFLLWTQNYLNNPSTIASIDMILIDQMGNKIVASVKKFLIQDFGDILQEGNFLDISNFGVVPYKGNYLLVQNEWKINFCRTTKVKRCEDFDVATDGYNLVSFDDVLEWRVSSIFAFGKPQVSNQLFGSRLHINSDISPIKKFISELVNNDSVNHLSSQVADFEPNTVIESSIDYFIKPPVKNIEELRATVEVSAYVVKATIAKVMVDDGWFMYACKKCNKRVHPKLMEGDTGKLFDCDTCGTITSVIGKERNEKADSQSHDGSHFERKSSEQNIEVPPSYEDAVAGGRSPIYNERDSETKSASPPETTVSSSPTVAPVAATPPPPPEAISNNKSNGFDEFDPRGFTGSFPGAPPASGGPETDFFGSSSDPFSLNELAIVPVTVSTSEPDNFTNSNPSGQSQTFVAASSASSGFSQQLDDPFGDGPFRAVASTDAISAPPQSTSAFSQSPEPQQSTAPTSESVNNFGYGDNFDKNTNILADLLPPSGPSQTGFQAQPNQTLFPSSFMGQPSFQGGQFMSHGGFPSQTGSGFPGSSGQPANQTNFYGGFEPQGSSAPVPPVAQATANSSFYQQPQVQSGSTLNASTGALVVVPQEPAKFETKSTVWADTLNRGLVNLNIAGSKTNPMSNIGVDFEALNRKEKRMEKPSMIPMTSNLTMGKAMGSGTGIGRAGAGALRPQPNPMMGSSMVGPAAPVGYGAGYNQHQQQPMGQFQMQPPGTSNPMMGRGGGYGQQPYGGGYR